MRSTEPMETVFPVYLKALTAGRNPKAALTLAGRWLCAETNGKANAIAWIAYRKEKKRKYRGLRKRN